MRWLKGRQGFVTPHITVFDDPEVEGMYIDKPVEVCVDAEAKMVYVWIKDSQYGIKLGEEKELLQESTLVQDGVIHLDPVRGPGSFPPWPAPEPDDQ